MKGIPLHSPAWLQDGKDWWVDALKNTEDAKKRLDEYIIALRKIDLGSIEGADELLDLLKKRQAEIKDEIEVLTAIQEGSERFHQDKNYQKVIDALKNVSRQKIQDSRKQQQIAAWIDHVIRRAEYLRDLQAVAHTIEGLEGFFKHHPDAPDDVERRAHQDLRDELASLRIEAAKKKRIAELETIMASLAKEGSLDKLKQSAVQFKQQLEGSKDLEEADRSEMRKRARGVLGDWLINVAFPRKRPPAKLLAKDNQEGLANHRRYIGKFFLDDLHYYRIWYWYGKKDPIADPQGDEKIDRMQVSDLVKPPRYVQWASVYNETSEALARGGADPENAKPLHQQWKEFFEQCKKTQDEFDRYQDGWGTVQEPDRSCKDWSFLPDSKSKVLPHRNLDDLGQQLEDLWRLFQP